ncbi:MAG: hypothetical protein AAFQ65_03615 [Myxococcota bacterium]
MPPRMIHALSSCVDHPIACVEKPGECPTQLRVLTEIAPNDIGTHFDASHVRAGVHGFNAIRILGDLVVSLDG